MSEEYYHTCLPCFGGSEKILFRYLFDLFVNDLCKSFFSKHKLSLC